MRIDPPNSRPPSRARPLSVRLKRRPSVSRSRNTSGRSGCSTQVSSAGRSSTRPRRRSTPPRHPCVRSRRSRARTKWSCSTYRVSAPTEGIIGDIPVRVGDRVTTATLLTTIDEGTGLEVYIYVPIERAAALRPGLRVRLVDDKGSSLADTTINFVSPQVDNRTQTVLAKAAISGHAFRTDQFVRARIVWATEPAYTVPVLAVSRVNGQYLRICSREGRQRAGRAAAAGQGRRTGWQRLRRAGRAEERRSRRRLRGAAPGGWSADRRSHQLVVRSPRPQPDMFVDTFIHRPVLSTVCSLVIIIAGAIAIPTMPVAQYPQLAPPQVSVTAVYTGASAQTVESAVTIPLEQAINGVEGLRTSRRQVPTAGSLPSRRPST